MISNHPSSVYTTLSDQLRRIADIRYATAVLQWDQETHLPTNGAAIRGQQIATLSELSHQLFTDPANGRLLQELLQNEQLSALEKKNVALCYEDYQRQTLFDSAFVKEMATVTQEAFHQWIKARTENDFTVFAPTLEKIVRLKQKEADILGYQDHPYNALLNDHDKGLTVALCDQTFDALKQPLKKLIDQIPVQTATPLHPPYPRSQQWDLSIDLLKKMGYDFESGRQDISEHPFSIAFNPNDVRITTRIDENDYSNMIWSTIHELGHAFYEQGLPVDQYGLPAGEAASYSIHESQSRLWENHVGRSAEFCVFLLPILKQYFPHSFQHISSEQFYQSVNQVKPSLIRTEADELTYHFHIIIRYEIEKGLITGELKVKDIPLIWKDLYMKYLNIQVPDDRLGALQDVHWSHGSFGYFPTYSIGSLYAAQFFEKAADDIKNLSNDIRTGRFDSLLKWLRTHIHQYGRTLTSEELCNQVTGKGLDIQPFLHYAEKKFHYA